MNTGVFISGPFGEAITRYYQEFDNEMDKKGYENPFWRKQQISNQAFSNLNTNFATDKRFFLKQKPLSTNTKETQPQVLVQGKKYISIEDYIRQRDEYTVMKIYEISRLSDELKKFLIDKDMEYMIKKMKPCLVGDKQCNMFCPDFPCNE